MFRAFWIATALTVLVSTLSWAGDAVRLNGSTSVANGIVIPHQAEIEKDAGVRIILTPNSSGDGLTDLFSEHADVAMISSDLNSMVTKMDNWAAIYRIDKASFYSFSLGTAQVEFIVNQTNPVKRLTGEQLKSIYLGKITNWKNVGGSNAPIEIFTEGRTGAMQTLFEHDLLGGQPLTGSVTVAFDAPGVAKWVSHSSHGIGFISSTTPASDRKGTASVETDVQIVQHLNLVTHGEPDGDVKRVVDAIMKFRH